MPLYELWRVGRRGGSILRRARAADQSPYASMGSGG